jgi:hypothetical protein
VAEDLYRMAGLGPADVGVVQSYENFTGGVVMALAEHRFFSPQEANDFLTLENLIAPSGRLPLNTSGGNLAECYMHGFELVLEAVRAGARHLHGAGGAQRRGAGDRGTHGGAGEQPVAGLARCTGETPR